MPALKFKSALHSNSGQYAARWGLPRLVLASRIRDPSDPSTPVEPIPSNISLETRPYSDPQSVGILFNGILYAVPNISTDGDNAPNGTIIIKKLEE